MKNTTGIQPVSPLSALQVVLVMGNFLTAKIRAALIEKKRSTHFQISCIPVKISVTSAVQLNQILAAKTGVMQKRKS